MASKERGVCRGRGPLNCKPSLFAKVMTTTCFTKTCAPAYIHMGGHAHVALPCTRNRTHVRANKWGFALIDVCTQAHMYLCPPENICAAAVSSYRSRTHACASETVSACVYARTHTGADEHKHLSPRVNIFASRLPATKATVLNAVARVSQAHARATTQLLACRKLHRPNLSRILTLRISREQPCFASQLVWPNR